MELNFQLKLGVWSEDGNSDDKLIDLWKDFSDAREKLIKHLEHLSVYPISQVSPYWIHQGAIE